MGLMGCSPEADLEPEVVPQGEFSPEVASYVTWFEEAERAAGGRAESSGTNGTAGTNESYGTNGTYESYETYESYGSYETNGSYGSYGSYETTRAWAVPSGYEPYEDGIQSVGIAFTKDGEDPTKGADPNYPKTMIGSFFYSSGKWHTSLTDIKTSTYYLYGYIPHQTAIKYSITDRSGRNDSYSTGAIMTLANVPTVMSHDLCVAIGVKHGFDKDHDGDYTDTNSNKTYDEGTDTRTNRLRRGDFAFTAAPTSNEDPKNFVFMLFDHLYASLRINLRVYNDYDELRTIKLKKLMLRPEAGDTACKDHNTITVTLAANGTGSDPITEIDYLQTGEVIGSREEDDKGIVFWPTSSSTGKTLTTSFQTFTGYFMPIGITKLALTSVYDVYDKKGNKVREDCEATNTLVLSELFTGQTETLRGTRYTINMTVNPTYLYVLSEPDLNSPMVIIN